MRTRHAHSAGRDGGRPGVGGTIRASTRCCVTRGEAVTRARRKATRKRAGGCPEAARRWVELEGPVYASLRRFTQLIVVYAALLPRLMASPSHGPTFSWMLLECTGYRAQRADACMHRGERSYPEVWTQRCVWERRASRNRQLKRGLGGGNVGGSGLVQDQMQELALSLSPSALPREGEGCKSQVFSQSL
jgi:hypothetical protein